MEKATSTDPAEPARPHADMPSAVMQSAETGDLSSNARLETLRVIYQADRADQASTLTVALALVGTGLAYVTATLAFAQQIFESKIYHGYPWLALLIPLPGWMMEAYHSLILSSAMARSRSIKAIEEELKASAGYAKDARMYIGFAPGEKVFNIAEASFPHKLASIITYAFILLVIVGYTVFFVAGAPNVHLAHRLVAGGGYLLLLCATFSAYISGFALHNRADRVLQWRDLPQ